MKPLFVSLLLAIFPATAALADSLIVKGIEYHDVKISNIKGDDVYFTTSTGNETHKPLGDVTKITVDGEAAFNNAEAASAVKDYDKAVDGYDKTVRATNKGWLKELAAARLLESANKGGRFDAAVRSYIALAEKNPDTAKAIHLNMPRADSAYLTAAIAPLKQAIDATEKKPAAQELLMELLSDVYKAKGDLKGEEEINELLVRKQAERDPNSPAAQRAKITLMLTQARKALEAKDFERVIQGITAQAANIQDPSEEADALWYMAEARRGLAGDSKNADTWKEVAVAYMRIVANFPPSDPHVPQALLRTADIYAHQLNDPDAAKAILKRMIEDDYKGKEPAQLAQKELDKLK